MKEPDAIAAFAMLAAPGHLLRRAQQIAVDLYMQEVTAACGQEALRPRQFALLHAIAMHEGASQAELVRRSGIDRSTLAEMVRRLIDRGLLTRRRDAGDSRAMSVSLTPQGRQALLAVIPAVERAQQRILAALPPERRQACLADLRRLAGVADLA